MIVIGLTGSIGMGKSTTARMFAANGVPVHDADAVVHDLYRGTATPLIEAAFPGTTRDGVVDRDRLSKVVLDDRQAIEKLEKIVHPLVREAERDFLRNAYHSGTKLACLDIPLLFETGGDKRVDAVVVVTASPEIQKKRVLSRRGMTPERFQKILDRQTPDAEKRRRADFLVDSGHGFKSAERQVAGICRKLAELPGDKPCQALREALEA